jgi:histidinol-phosphate/aromatic aminotransferase/cobyric acid decarboxylase-like protein
MPPVPPQAFVPAPGPHGGDGPRVARALGWDAGTVLDLSLSLNPDAPDIAAIAARHVDALRVYPDPSDATAALAEALGVTTDRVLLTNGGAEAIALVGGWLGRAAVDRCDFSLYARHVVVDATAPRMRSNPHNPSGLLARPEERAAVWDEAFYPVATGTWTSGAADAGAVVLGSLTKVFACPGLRLGYVLAGPALIDALRAAQPRWSVNGLACAVLPELLARTDLRGWQEATATRRDALMQSIPGVLPSDASYALVHAPRGARALRDDLARRGGVLVRDCTSFGLPDYIRVAVPDAAGLRRLHAAWPRERP